MDLFVKSVQPLDAIGELLGGNVQHPGRAHRRIFARAVAEQRIRLKPQRPQQEEDGVVGGGQRFDGDIHLPEPRFGIRFRRGGGDREDHIAQLIAAIMIGEESIHLFKGATHDRKM